MTLTRWQGLAFYSYVYAIYLPSYYDPNNWKSKEETNGKIGNHKMYNKTRPDSKYRSKETGRIKASGRTKKYY